MTVNPPPSKAGHHTMPPNVHRGTLPPTPVPGLPPGSQYRIASSSPRLPAQVHETLDALIAALRQHLADLEAQAAAQAAAGTQPMPTTITVAHMPPGLAISAPPVPGPRGHIGVY